MIGYADQAGAAHLRCLAELSSIFFLKSTQLPRSGASLSFLSSSSFFCRVASFSSSFFFRQLSVTKTISSLTPSFSFSLATFFSKASSWSLWRSETICFIFPMQRDCLGFSSTRRLRSLERDLDLERSWSFSFLSLPLIQSQISSYWQRAGSSSSGLSAMRK